MTPPTVTIPQDRETEASVEALPGSTALTYVYARSRDTQKANAVGQDFIAFRYDETRLTFAVCDGVSQSFYGEIAARFIGLRLIEAIWNPGKVSLADQLNAWATPATELVQARIINPNLPEMQRIALERKRAQGSESMFIAGLVDFPSQCITLYWRGDMRFWLWDKSGGEISRPEMIFETKERWSTLVGMKNGMVRSLTLPLDEVAHLTVHSDGVGSFAPRLNEMSQDLLNSIVAEQLKSPASDDISVLDIDFHYPQIFGELMSLQAPVPHVSRHEPVLEWDHIRLASRYRVCMQTEQDTFTQEVDALLTLERVFTGHFSYFPTSADHPVVTCRVQALNDYTRPSAWSAPVRVSEQVPVTENVETATQPSRPSEKSPRPQKKRSRLAASLILLISCLLLILVVVAAWIAVTVLHWNELVQTP